MRGSAIMAEVRKGSPIPKDSAMKSPFPGMDPYIEAEGVWEDFHTDLIAEIRRALAALVPERYFVRIGHRAYIVLAEEDGKDLKPFIPDAALLAPADRREKEPAEAEPVGAALAQARPLAEQPLLRPDVPPPPRPDLSRLGSTLSAAAADGPRSAQRHLRAAHLDEIDRRDPPN